MKSMVYYELKKMFSLKKTIICAIVTVALCAVIFGVRASQYNLFKTLDSIKQDAGLFTGEITPEKFEATVKTYEEMLNNPDNYTIVDGESVMKQEVLEQFNKLEPLLHLKNLNEFPKRSIADLQKELAGQDITKNERLLIERNIEMLSKKGNLYMGYNLFYDYYDSFMRNFAPVILGFMIIFFISPIFASEYSSKMDGLILSSKRGKRGIIFAKFIAVLIGISIVFTFVVGVYIAVSASVLGFSGGNTSLTTIYYDPFLYLSSPYELTMLQYFLISLGVSYAACIGLGGLTIFISSKSNNALTVSTLSLGIFFVPLVFYSVTGADFPGIVNLAYARIMQVTPLFNRFTGFVILGRVLTIKEVSLTLLAIVSAMFALFSYRSFKGHQAAS